MRNGLFTAEEKSILLANKYVVDVVQDSQVIYANEFKKLFIEKYMAGAKPSKIFAEAGFDTKLLGIKRIERACYRWRAAYNNGELALSEAASVRHRENVKRRENRIEKLKQQHKVEVDALQFRLDNALARINFLQSEISRLERINIGNKNLKINFYIKEGIDVSEEVAYMGQKIGVLRRERGLSMEKLALALGFSHSTLREIERGYKPVPMETLLKAMRIFDCPIDVFFRYDSLET